MTSRKITPRQVWWASYLSSFFFNDLHTPGKQNPADPASRRPYSAPDPLTGQDLVTLLSPSCLQEGLTVMSLSTSLASINITFSLPPTEVRSLLTTAYVSERKLLSSPTSKLYCWRGGLWWFRDCLYVPALERSTILTSSHSPPTAGHLGVSRMLSNLTRTYSWPSVRQDVINFCWSCDSCQQTKISTQARSGELVPLPIPDRPWTSLISTS